jgi:hypothetical protein
MRRQVAQLAGFVDQAGLFRTLLAITNKLHSRFSLEWTNRLNSFMEQGGGKFNRSKRAHCRPSQFGRFVRARD